jgi:hypothetical protein
MGVAVVSVARGHDASYPFRTIGAAEGPVITGQCRAGCCLSVEEKGGEPAGTRRFGFECAYRRASQGRVIARFPEKAVAWLSSRPAKITKTVLALVGQREKDRGHAQDERAMASIRQFADAMMRRAKEPGALDFAALLHGWERASRAAKLGRLRDLARTMWHAQAPPQERIVIQPQNLPRRQRGSRRAGSSRMRRNARAALLGAGLRQRQTQLHAGAAGG